MHLDDLMLRRTRLGLVLPQGGLSCIEQMQKEVGPALGWSSEKWTQEIQRYEDIWNRAYSPRRIDGAPEKRKDDAPVLAAAG
jgi:glycerol-3-phosphate dehydrogenase